MKIISIYLFFLGWTAAFALPYFPITRIIGIIMLFSILFTFNYKKKLGLDKRLITLMYLLFLSFIVSYIFQIIHIGPSFTGFGHTLLFLGVIILHFVVVLVAISLTGYPTNKIYKFISWGVIFVSLITIIEFISRNFLNMEFNLLRISTDYIATYSISGERFIRARGTVIESGHLALYLLMFAPFVYHYHMNINGSKMKTIISLVSVVLAVLFTFSAAGFAELSVVILIILGVYIIKLLRQGFKLSKVIVIYPLFFSIISFGIYYFVYGNGNLSFLSGIFGKLTFENSTIYDGNSRLSRWYRAWELFKESPVVGQGSGIASITHGTGSTNLYLDILAGNGLIGLLIFLFILVYHLNLIFKMEGHVKYIYLVSFSTMAIHYAIISDYWYPWMWMLLVMINVQYYRQEKLEPDKPIKQETLASEKHFYNVKI
ncbi:O-antigen ligase family protein [Lentibacillus sediminis]|uniref:O-antigen ligase family protein n=1 Tax=Lentibacillus sediminis TaxID=1940529 RepID=UPI000C1BDC62|nr:O-antigen ligase family protein [Lentibacillus sediminis]